MATNGLIALAHPAMVPLPSDSDQPNGQARTECAIASLTGDNVGKGHAETR